MRLYTYDAVDNLIARYSGTEGATVIQTREGVLGSGDWLLSAPGKKTAIVQEVALNEWASGHKVRFYTETPKKYAALIQ
jgi:hypothetical protein